MTWLQVGSVAGPTAALPSVAFRSANFRVLGSGQGSVPTTGILAELPELATQIVRGVFVVNPVAVPLAAVEGAWTTPTVPGERVVIVPTSDCLRGHRIHHQPVETCRRRRVLRFSIQVRRY